MNFFTPFKKNLFILITAITLSIYFTFPLITGLNRNYFKNSDFYLNAWTYSYVAKSISNGKIFEVNKFFNAPQLYPLPQALASQDFFVIPTLILYLPFFMLTNSHVFSINVTIFMSFVLCFLSAYFCLKKLSVNSKAAIIGVIIFTFTPNTTHIMSGWLEYLNRFFIPPFFLLLIQYLTSPNAKKAFLLFFVYSLSWFTNIELTIFLTILGLFLSLVYTVIKFWQDRQMFIGEFWRIVRYLAIGLVFLPVIYFYFSPYIRYSEFEGISRSIQEANFHSIKISDLHLPTFGSNIFNGLFKYNLKNMPFPGYFTLIFSSFFIVKNITSYISKKIKFGRNDVVWIIFLLSLIFSFVLSLGPFVTFGDIVVKLPYFYLYKVFPLLAAIRTPDRLTYVWIFFFSYIISFGLKWFFTSLGKRLSLVAFLLIGSFLLVEYRQPYQIQESSFHTLNYDLKDNRVLFLPFRDVNSKMNDSKYLAQNVGKDFVMVNGYTGSEGQLVWHSELINFFSSYNFDRDWFNVAKALNINKVVIDKSEKLNDKIINFVNRNKEIVVFEDTNWSVVDINGLGDNVCSDSPLNKLGLSFGIFKDKKSNLINIQIRGKNSSDCTMTFLSENRYLPIKYSFDQHLLHPRKRYLKLPTYLLPGQEFTYWEQLNDLTLENHQTVFLETLGKGYILNIEKERNL